MIRGKHQQLDNGNILITEPQSGRVFEVDRSGDLVWEYQNRYDEDRNLLVSKSIWLPQDFFNWGTPTCADTASGPDAQRSVNRS